MTSSRIFANQERHFYNGFIFHYFINIWTWFSTYFFLRETRNDRFQHLFWYNNPLPIPCRARPLFNAIALFLFSAGAPWVDGGSSWLATATKTPRGRPPGRVKTVELETATENTKGGKHQGKETWWWSNEVQKRITRKIHSKQVGKESKLPEKAVAKTKEKAWTDWYDNRGRWEDDL